MKPERTSYCWGCGEEKVFLRVYLLSWLCATCIKHLEGEVKP